MCKRPDLFGTLPPSKCSSIAPSSPVPWFLHAADWDHGAACHLVSIREMNGGTAMDAVAVDGNKSTSCQVIFLAGFRSTRRIRAGLAAAVFDAAACGNRVNVIGRSHFIRDVAVPTGNATPSTPELDDTNCSEGDRSPPAHVQECSRLAALQDHNVSFYYPSPASVS